MEISRKQLTKIIYQQSKKLPRDSFISYDGNDSNEELLICRYRNEIRILIQALKNCYSQKIGEMEFKERAYKKDIINTIILGAESFNFDFQIWHALNMIDNILDAIFIKINVNFIKQYPNFAFIKNVLLDIANSYLIDHSKFDVQAIFFPIHTYGAFDDFYRFENSEKLNDFIKNPEKQLVDSINTCIGLHYSVPVRIVLNIFFVFDDERRLYKTCLFDIRYDISKKEMLVIPV